MPENATPVASAQQVVNQDLDYIVANLDGVLDKLAGRQLLIIGGAGFLGYYLTQSVVHFNRSVDDPEKVIHMTVFDNFIRGVPEWLNNLSAEPNVVIEKFDVIDPLTANHGSFDFIIHAASIASPTFYRQYPIETMDANVTGIRNVLEYALQQKQAGSEVTGILFYSTSEIYGDPDPANIPTPETYRGNVSCTGPRACYDESKRYGETLCVNFASQHHVPVRIARPFNNYGPGLKIDDARVLPDFCRDILNERDIIMYSDGKPTRTFCYITDAIVGYFRILVLGKNGESYNIGTEAPEISMRALADSVVQVAEDLFNYKGKVVMQASSDDEYLVDNPNRRCPDIAKARKEIGYDPGIDLDTGLRNTLLWYAENREQKEKG